MFDKLINKAMILLLEGDNDVLRELRKQYENANISDISNTGVGLFVSFVIPENIECINTETIKEDFVLGDVYGTINDVFGSVGFIIFVKNGYLKTLEIYSIGEEFWEQVTDDIEIGYESNPRNISDLEKTWTKST